MEQSNGPWRSGAVKTGRSSGLSGLRSRHRKGRLPGDRAVLFSEADALTAKEIPRFGSR